MGMAYYRPGIFLVFQWSPNDPGLETSGASVPVFDAEISEKSYIKTFCVGVEEPIWKFCLASQEGEAHCC